jgi:magnesium transporter
MRPPEVTRIRYSPQRYQSAVLDQLDAASVEREAGEVIWINVEGLADSQLIERLGELFELHPLSLEDVVHSHHRAKTEDYDHYLFVVARMVTSGVRLATEQISMFLGRDFVLTLQDGAPGDCLDAVRQRLERGHGQMRRNGADYLAYAILDAVIDSYFPVVEDYGERLDELDEQLMGPGRYDAISQVHQLRSELLMLRRLIWPHREAVNSLLRQTHDFVSEETRVYLRDSYDHTIQLIDVVEVYREMCSDLRDYYLSILSNRANEIMKVLTIIATIFIPLSFIASVYGMNFRYMPELNWRYGYPAALGLMGVVGAGLVFYIWRHGWLRH